MSAPRPQERPCSSPNPARCRSSCATPSTSTPTPGARRCWASPPHVVAESFPHTMPAVWLYVPFTGAQGVLMLWVRILDGQSVLVEAGGQATCGDPDSTYELTTP